MNDRKLFIGWIIEVLMDEHKLSKKESERIVNESVINELLETDEAYVYHYQPSDWADLLVERSNQIEQG